MTAIAYPQKNSINIWPLMLLLLAGLLYAVINCPHAVLKHGSDALEIRDCLDRNGPYQVWKSTQFDNQFFKICELDKGIFGFQIVRVENGVENEVTAFIKGDGSWGQLVKYLGRIATRFNGG